jgi:hypothetical protein
VRHLSSFLKTLSPVAMLLLCFAIGSAQIVSTRKRTDSMTKHEPATPADGPVLTRDNTLKYTAFYNDPCAIITRDELEAILKRNENDRALVSVGEPVWHDNMTKVGCAYGVKYEQRILPDESFDNSVNIWIDFNEEHVKQGKLLIDPNKDPFKFRRYSDSDFDLQIVNGVGDEALYARDKSRFKYEERRAGTAGGSPYVYYDNGDFLYVRRKQILLGFQVTRIVAGGGDPNTVIQIGRKALERVP